MTTEPFEPAAADPVRTGTGRSTLFIAAAAMALLLAACGMIPDAGQARQCRIALAMLNPPATAIEIERVGAMRGASGVHVFYRATGAGEAAPGRLRLASCRFADDSLASAGRQELVEILSDGVLVGPIRVALMRRFWLETSEGQASDPAPYHQIGRLAEVPLRAAIGLQQLISALPMIAIYGLLAAAYALIYGLTQRINLAFGELAALGGYATLIAIAMASAEAAIGGVLAFALMLVVWSLSFLAIAVARLILLPLAVRPGQHMLIATIGLALVLQEMLRISQGSALRWTQPILNAPVGLARAGTFVVTITPVALLVTALSASAAVALVAGMRRSRFGRHWRAVADDLGAASLLGIDPRAVIGLSMLAASALAGLAGYVMTVFYGGIGYAGGFALGLKALIGAVAGGIGSVPGALIGGILIGGFEALWSALFPIEQRDLAVYLALAALLIWRPGGLLGFAEPETSRASFGHRRK